MLLQHSFLQTTGELQNLNWYEMVRPTDIVRTCHWWLKKAVERAWSAWLVLKHLSLNVCPKAKIHSCLQGGNVSRIFWFSGSSLAKLSELNEVLNVKNKKIATSRSTICSKMSTKSYCEGPSNDLVVTGEQHGQPQPLIRAEFVMPPVSNYFSVLGKERKR